MKYMWLLAGDEEEFSAQPVENAGRALQNHMAVERELTELGRFVDGDPLQLKATAVTVRRRGEELMVTDGPFLETKEHIGGFYLMEADSMEDAVAWAGKLEQTASSSAVEVRPARTGAQWRGPVRGKERFMLLLVSDRERAAQTTREEVFRSIDQHYELSLRLAAEGRFWGSRSLGSDAESRTLRPGEGGIVVSDGPFAETKEFVAGYFIVACDSMDEAVEVAKELCEHAVEVRPIFDLHNRSRARSSAAS